MNTKQLEHRKNIILSDMVIRRKNRHFDFKHEICPKCSSERTRRDGVRDNRDGIIPKYECLDYRRLFSINPHVYDNEKFKDISRRLSKEGLSSRHIAKILTLEYQKISHVTIARWIKYKDNDEIKIQNDIIQEHEPSEYRYINGQLEEVKNPEDFMTVIPKRHLYF